MELEKGKLRRVEGQLSFPIALHPALVRVTVGGC